MRQTWIQFRLGPDKETDSVEIDWYRGGSRTARYTVEISNDGKNWRPAEYRTEDSPSAALISFSVNQETDGEVKVSGSLQNPGQLRLQLEAIKGRPILAGVVLRQVEQRRQEDSQ